MIGIARRLVCILSRLGFLVSMMLWAVAGRAEADAPGVRIVSTLQGSRIVTTLSAEGASVSHYSSPDGDRLIRRFIARYSDGALWAVDGERRTFLATSTAARIERVAAQTRHVMASTPGFVEGRAASGTARLTILSDRARINDVDIVAALLTMPDQSWRIWYAPSLPRLPAALRPGLAQLTPVDPQSQPNLGKIVGYAILRTEFNDGTGWRTVLDTEGVQRLLVPSTEFTPPSDHTPITAHAEPPTPPGGVDLSAQVIRGPGPEMSNPELSVVFWGKVLNDPANGIAQAQLRGALQDITSDEYIAPLTNYDIRSARIDGFYYRPDLPPRAVGASNFAAITAMVYDVGFKEGAPIFWWAVGGHDPMYALLVANSEVDNSSWGGYHFVAFSLTHAVLPFPATLFAHDAMPWFLAKIPDAAMRVGTETRSRRYECAALPAARPSGCDGLAGFDEGTNTVSHEFVETASDPYVFLGWSDPTKQPFYSKSEISDICESKPLPWGDSSVVLQRTSVSTYWSNSARACVPESRPTLTVFEPTPGQVVPTASGHVTLRGHAHDPVDGPLSNVISWNIDGGVLGHGETADSGALTEGSHALTAVVTNSRGLQSTASLGFAVSTPAAKAIISSPAAGDYWNSQRLVFRGQGFVFQPGDVPDNDLRWDDGGVPLGTGPLLFRVLPSLGDHAIRFSVLRGGQAAATATVNVRIKRAGPHIRTPPSVMITMPSPAQSVFHVDYGADRSAPIQFVATVTDASGMSIPATLSWASDIDGPLGNGAIITTTLSGGYGAATVHRITVTAVGTNGARSTDTIELTIGQVS